MFPAVRAGGGLRKPVAPGCPRMGHDSLSLRHELRQELEAGSEIWSGGQIPLVSNLGLQTSGFGPEDVEQSLAIMSLRRRPVFRVGRRRSLGPRGSPPLPFGSTDFPPAPTPDDPTTSVAPFAKSRSRAQLNRSINETGCGGRPRGAWMAATEEHRAAPVGGATEKMAARSGAAGRPAAMNTGATGPDSGEARLLHREDDPRPPSLGQTTNAAIRKRTGRIRDNHLPFYRRVPIDCDHRSCHEADGS